MVSAVACQVSGFFDRGTCRDLDAHAHFIRHHMGKGGFSKSRRTVKQDMIQRLTALLCRGKQDRQVFTHLILSGYF